MIGRGVRLLVGGVMLTIGMLLPGTAAATDSNMQALLNPDGTGMLFADAAAGPFSWERCNQDLSACAPAGDGRELNIGNAPDGSVFRLAGGSPAEVSPVWHGNLQVAAPPRIEGSLSANELVTPVPASWSGGWDGGFDQTQLAACETAAGEHCTSLTDPKFPSGCANGAAFIDPSFAGDFLRVADARFGPDTISPPYAVVSPYGQPIWPADGATAVAMAGQIGPPTHDWKATCGPGLLPGPPAPPSSPEIVEERLAEGSISRTGVGSAKCRPGCRAVMIASRSGRQARVVASVPSVGKPATRSLRLSKTEIKKLGARRVHFVLKLDGKKVAERTVAFPIPRKRGRPR